MSNPATQFKPGEVHNPNGRPPKEWTMKGLIQQALEESNETGVPKKKLIAEKLVSIGLSGDMVAIKEINNRIDGLPHQTTDLTSGGKPIPLFGHELLSDDSNAEDKEADQAD